MIRRPPRSTPTRRSSDLDLATIRDISKEKEAKERLKQNEEKFRILFDDAVLPKLLIDSKTERFVDVNKAACQFYGYTKNELLKKTTQDISLLPKSDFNFQKNQTLTGKQNYFFSKHKIESIEDVRKSRIWLWQGDPLGEAFFEASDVSPIPLSIIDVYPQLSAKHGSIDTVYVSTFGAIALQWHSKLKYATNIALTNAIGGLVISNKFFDKLPQDLQRLLKTTGKTMSDSIRNSTRLENQKSHILLEESGIVFLWDWDDNSMEQFIEIRDKAAKHLENTNYIPASFFNKTRDLLTQYRNEKQR